LSKEKAETKKRVALLKEQTKLEKLRKEAIDREKELLELKRPSQTYLKTESMLSGSSNS